MDYTPDVSGPLADHVLELYQRAAFLELFAALLAEFPEPDGVLHHDNMYGLFRVAQDLAGLARAVNNRLYRETAQAKA
ncbi:MAG: hypothetical protein LBQ10_07320 [Desulfovibrio sp.]|jgi:hypothetical protein|nr:hypothetical protein [Desulfovibrio sp.]